MDPREVIVLSSGDEMSIEPYRTPSDESDGRNRAFSGPVEMSLGSDDLHGGKDLSFRILFVFMSCLLCSSKMELLFHTAGNDEHDAFLHQGIVIGDAASRTPDPPAVLARRTPADETVARVQADLLGLLWERINVLERTLREVKVRAREAEQKNKDLQQEIRTLKAEVRKLTGQGRDPAEASRRDHP